MRRKISILGLVVMIGALIGLYLTELKEQWRIDRTWKPFIDAQTRETLFAQWKKAVSRSLNWID